MNGKFDKKPDNEEERIVYLKSLCILDSEYEDHFDDFTEIASHIAQTPIALISLVDEERQWFKSRKGLNASETARDISFCTYVVYHGDELIVEDPKKDERFVGNPLVEDGVVGFYAGFPITTKEGYTLGTLCLIDNKPKTLSPEQTEQLRRLSYIIRDTFSLRKVDQKSKDFKETINRSINDFSLKTSTRLTNVINNKSIELDERSLGALKSISADLDDLNDKLNEVTNNMVLTGSRPSLTAFDPMAITHSIFSIYQSFFSTSDLSLDFNKQGPAVFYSDRERFEKLLEQSLIFFLTNKYDAKLEIEENKKNIELTWTFQRKQGDCKKTQFVESLLPLVKELKGQISHSSESSVTYHLNKMDPYADQ